MKSIKSMFDKIGRVINMLDVYSKGKHISEAMKSVGKRVLVKGWIYRKRSSGGKIFCVVRDVSDTMQCVVDKSKVSSEEWGSIDKAYLESSIVLEGVVKSDERAPGGKELEVSNLMVLHSGEQFPITEYQSTEFLLDVRHLWLRSEKMKYIMQARSHLFRYIREHMDKNGFYEVTPPLITLAGGETGANLFEVNYFDSKAYLTESSQLYVEALIYALEKVYSFAPSYRAEKSRTTKHLAEYWHLEPEMAYFDNQRNMKFQESLVSGIASKLAKNDEEILHKLNVDVESIKKVRSPFKRISYEQAIDILNQKGSKIKWGDDFGVEEERLLTSDEDKPIFIYNWPKEIKAFYMPVNPKDPRTVLCADLQAPHGHGEIIGGSERIWKLEELLERMNELKMNVNNYSWYIDLRRYGSVPHAGFGMGVERVLKWLLNLDHIRDAIPFPRMINRIKP
ncbi:MAG: asparagine--tRNA ligase [Candidatus Micrarchaeia archaeon]